MIIKLRQIRRPAVVLAWSLSVALSLGSLAEGDGPKARPIRAEDRLHWAFKPPRSVEIPRVHDPRQSRNWIDAFIVEKLEEAGLSPAPEADRAALLRRLTFDLIGLPPTPEEIDAFLADESPNAYEKQVDRLLADPSYGERWAQHWLDLARYADTDGFEFDQIRPDAWRYRDWVVDAFNRDLPYDRFVRLQIAGPEIEPNEPSAFVATGFNRCQPDMVDLNDQGLRRQIALNDITETTGLVFLGLTIGCARCHDHKFDPIRQVDFYRLQAFFGGARFRDDYPIASAEERREFETRRKRYEAGLRSLEAELLGIESPAREKLAPGPPPGIDDQAAAALRKKASDRSSDEIRRIFEAFSKDQRVSPLALNSALDPLNQSARLEAVAARTLFRTTVPKPPPTARGIDSDGRRTMPVFFLKRGEYARKGPEVSPMFPLVLVPTEADAIPKIEPGENHPGRAKALADWLSSPSNPLTARVLVNRFWQFHFNEGIVSTPSDFGVNGAEPTHPELLDRLSVEFAANGWSMKRLHRLIVTSATYRQSSRTIEKNLKVDPQNSLFWRQNRRRLDGETIRDALLSVSGTLNPARGGPGVFPPLPSELAGSIGKGNLWPTSPRKEDRNRRGLYVFVRRNLRYPFFEAFDKPDTNASCPKRAVATIAPQALALLNGEPAQSAARSFADRVLREAGPNVDARIVRAYRLALGRSPDASERSLAREFLQTAGPNAAVDFSLALINVNEFVYID